MKPYKTPFKLPFPVIGSSIDRNVYALRETLFRLFQHWGIPHYAAGGAWEYLQAKYTEPHRVYHTLGHIVHMFNEAARIGWLNNLYPAEILAILYHDVVYELGTEDPSANEQASAMVAHELIHLVPDENNVAVAQIAHAGALIKDTAAYLGEPTHAAGNSHRVMDLDLSTFGAPWELFDMSNQLVRQEFDIDKKTHAKFHQKLLDSRDTLFRTREAIAQWEKQARKNMTRYIKEAEEE